MDGATRDVGDIDEFDVTEFDTVHEYVTSALFKPDMYEVARQIPDDGVEAFVTTEPFSTKAPQCFTADGTLHRGVTKRLIKIS